MARVGPQRQRGKGGGRGEYAISRSRSSCDKLLFDRPDVNLFPPLNVREKSNLPRSFNR